MLNNIKNIKTISIEKFNSFIIKVLDDFGKAEVERKIANFCFELKDDFYLDFERFSQENRFFYFDKPSENYKIIGLKSLYDINKNGSDRFIFTSESISKLKNEIVSNFNEYNEIEIPLVVGGMKFTNENQNNIWNDFYDTDWFIPEFLFFQKAGRKFLVYNFFIRESLNLIDIKKNLSDFFDDLNTKKKRSQTLPGISAVKGNSENDKAKWIKSVSKILTEIESGKIHKAVFSRKLEIELKFEPDLEKIMQNLKNKFPECYIFAHRKRDSIFFGASPEKLLKLTQEYIETDALAGSAPRGNNLNEDLAIENNVLKSQKNLNEHYFVRNYITNVLNENSIDLIYNETPEIKKLKNIQHLWTPIIIKTTSNAEMFSILERIHPTPAVCGVPLSDSLNLIKSIEDYPRGMYSGITGWFNLNKSGEFCVAIRSALLKANKIYAFAGGGIVKGSEAETEFNETEIKFNPILSLFYNED